MQMLPRLQAEEALQAVRILNAADMKLDVPVRARIIQCWQTIANGGAANGGAPPVTGRRVSEMTPAQERVAFAELGFTVKTVTPN